MTKREKQLYKGKKSNTKFFLNSIFNFFLGLFKNKITPIVLSILILFSFVLSTFEKSGVVSWNQLFTYTGLVDGVKPVNSDFAIYYLDVGQSDCTIIKCDDKVLLIDTGTKNQLYTIRKSLFTLDIDTIDYMIVTHQHDDHMSGAAEIIEHYNVKNIMMPKLYDVNSVDSLTFKDLINKIGEYNVKPIAVKSGYSFELGSASVEILAPIKLDKNINNMSIILKITYGDNSFIFQGDSEEKIENQLLNLEYDISADVIKIGHHGSKTSSNVEYLNEVNPDYAVISCGPDNNYGHPSNSVVDKLEEKGIVTYVTSLHGNITAISDGEKVSFITEE